MTSSGGGSAARMAAGLAAVGDKTATSWAAGAEGERRVAAALDTMPPVWTSLHDRLLEPGLTEVNLDHVVVGPAGVFVVDAKLWGGTVNVWHESLFRHKTGAGGAVSHECMDREVDKVKWLADVMATALGVHVFPVLCLASGRTDGLKVPTLVRGVMVVPVSGLVDWLGSLPEVFAFQEMARVVTTCMTVFPSTDADPRLLACSGTSSLLNRELVREQHRELTPRTYRPRDQYRSRGRYGSRGGYGAQDRYSPRRTTTRPPSRSEPVRPRPRSSEPPKVSGFWRAVLVVGAVMAGLSFMAALAGPH